MHSSISTRNVLMGIFFSIQNVELNCWKKCSNKENRWKKNYFFQRSKFLSSELPSRRWDSISMKSLMSVDLKVVLPYFENFRIFFRTSSIDCTFGKNDTLFIIFRLPEFQVVSPASIFTIFLQCFFWRVNLSESIEVQNFSNLGKKKITISLFFLTFLTF